jgi:hypothetical protein
MSLGDEDIDEEIFNDRNLNGDDDDEDIMRLWGSFDAIHPASMGTMSQSSFFFISEYSAKYVYYHPIFNRTSRARYNGI